MSEDITLTVGCLRKYIEELNDDCEIFVYNGDEILNIQNINISDYCEGEKYLVIYSDYFEEVEDNEN